MKNFISVVLLSRNNSDTCISTLEKLCQNIVKFSIKSVNIVIFSNDTDPGHIERLYNYTVNAAKNYQISFQFIRSKKDWRYAEENIINNALDNAELLSDYVIFVGSTDEVQVEHLPRIAHIMRSNDLDYMVINFVNRDIMESGTYEMSGRPDHLNYVRPRNAPMFEIKKDTYREEFMRLGPVDYMSFIGLVVYKKSYMVKVLSVELPDPLYFMGMANLEVTELYECKGGYYHGVTVLRVESVSQPNTIYTWWVTKSRMDSGLSVHWLMAIIANSILLCDSAFEVLINCRCVAIRNKNPKVYFYSTFIIAFTDAIWNGIRDGLEKTEYHRYSLKEIQDIINFGERLKKANLYIDHAAKEKVCQWLLNFDKLDKHDPYGVSLETVRQLVAEGGHVHALLKRIDDNERWVAQLYTN